MNSTHTMRLPVRAWQVGPDGSLPLEVAVIVKSLPITLTWNNHWKRWTWGGDFGDENMAHPGDWIVQSTYGLESMTDAEFRARCEEVMNG